MAKAFTTMRESGGNRRRPRKMIAVGGTVAIVVMGALAVGLIDASGGHAAAPLAAATVSPTAPTTLVPLPDMTYPTNPQTTDPRFFPPSNGPGKVTITQAEAVKSALAQAVSATGGDLASQERAALPTYSRLMTYAESFKLTGDGNDPRIDPSREVWVVSVLGHHVIDTPPMSTASPITDKYTIVTDATTGYTILGVFGAAFLTS